MILRSNYLLLEETDRSKGPDEILRVATLHKADRISSQAQEVACSFLRHDKRPAPQFVPVSRIQQWCESR